MKDYNMFSQNGVVSIWIGNFSSDLELDDYLNITHSFEKDFDFKYDEKNAPEVTVESQPTSIKELVNGFSWSSSYSNEVVTTAKIQGINSATTMIIFLNFKYDPDKTNLNKNAPLQFLGAFSFS